MTPPTADRRQYLTATYSDDNESAGLIESACRGEMIRFIPLIRCDTSSGPAPDCLWGQATI